jgi:hypothetical protein
MRKIYSAPAMISTNDVVRATMTSSGITTEAEDQKPLGSGSVGFYL